MFTACGNVDGLTNTDDDEILAQQTAKAQDAANKASSEEMESDLERRYRFYEAVEGSYAGILQTQQGKFNITVDLYLSHPRYPKDPHRTTRTMKEIEHDLNSLSFIAYVNQWKDADANISVGCIAQNIVPDMNTGEINIAASGCKNAYPIFLSDPKNITEAGIGTLTPSQASDEKTQAIQISQALLDGKLNKVLQLRGQVKSTNIPQIYELLVTRE